MLPKIFHIGFFGLAIVFLATFAQASSGAATHEPSDFMKDWLPRLVNFGIIAAVAVYLLKKPITTYFKNRSAEIAKAMQESQAARERTVAELAEMEQKMKALELETEKMIAEARMRGEKDRQELLEEGKRLVQDIQSQVQQGIEIEVRKAKNALTTEAALLSVTLAEAHIKEHIGAKDQTRIVKDYISEMGGKA
jgi:F-type H+-transporting ATPase subunit b